MQSRSDKWKEELKKENYVIRTAWLEHQKDVLDSRL